MPQLTRSRAAAALVALLCLSVAAPAQHAAASPAAPAPAPAACPAAPDCQGRNAPYAFTQSDFAIDVPMPDMLGNPVQLDARLLVPTGAGPFAGLLINHGYLGSKADDSDTAEKAARAGYIVLRYSSRGFGATKGQVDLVGDKEISDMLTAVHWLNDPANVPKIWVDHIGHYGGSYGGAHDLQLGVANDPAIRALVPAATWYDLYAGLVPNDVLKLTYLTGFYGAGRERTDGYNNYDPEIDAAYAASLAGALTEVKSVTQKHSTFDELNKITTPTFIVQGLNDGLFDGNQAIRAYQALSAQGTPVRMYLGGIGHPPARAGGGYEVAHVTDEVLAFLDHYVRGVDNGIERAAPIEFGTAQWTANPDFAPGDAGVRDRVRAATAYPFGATTSMQLCGSATPGAGTLQAAACPSALPIVLAAGTGGDPSSEPVAGKYLQQYYKQYFGADFPSAATPVDVVTLDGPVLSAPASFAGIPTLHLSVLSDPQNAASPAGAGGAVPTGSAAFQVDPKVYDVAPDGSKVLVTRGAYAEQLGAGAPGVHTDSFEAFALAHVFGVGHRVELSLSSADALYLRPNAGAFQVLVMPGSTIDLLGTERATAPIYGVAPADAPAPAPAPALPEAPLPALLLLPACAALLLLRRHRART